MADRDPSRAPSDPTPPPLRPAPSHPTTPLHPMSVPAHEAADRCRGFYQVMDRRRTVRDYSTRPLPEGVLEWAVRTAATAPSGAHVQPWRFVVVTDPERKRRLREAAEAEEREFYAHRASEEWLAALAPIGTDWHKPFLEDAPAVIVVFEVHKGPNSPRPYYTKESVGIAVGFLLSALHQAGLATLTHTPSPMRFLNEVCDRPPEERAAYVIPVGYPAEDARVPDLVRKPLDEVLVRL
ncbi:nitroreductase family protein [Kitasatospora sp. NPDC001540]|uniref:nitroreductase family protein n=1 Tax=Kitasatospora sp. NPDC001540 TaxID=3364014 RepID=UPI0036914B08